MNKLIKSNWTYFFRVFNVKDILENKFKGYDVHVKNTKPHQQYVFIFLST